MLRPRQKIPIPNMVIAVAPKPLNAHRMVQNIPQRKTPTNEIKMAHKEIITDHSAE